MATQIISEISKSGKNTCILYKVSMPPSDELCVMKHMEDKVVLITGTAQGIGFATAKTFAEA
ncbi:hypothetical protein [Pedobacter heparinus]|uniref:hypothetical protein n=1 Tax=Pedobacter heparinus TaxID=984 RepID=UPI00292D8163|nr:hypothetical protein [Pedobacter heparinus]